ncbi:MAG: XRE family transcriptional regulator [Alphaproteobacteria bacterium]|nr:MAG: XRE family transcriptional regulator [Alphaproteobacteria bacterium]
MAINLEKRVGMAVAAAREALGWSQADLAEKAGIHETSVSNLERGKKEPSLGTLTKVANAFGCPLQDLLPPAPLQGTTRKRFKLELDTQEMLRQLSDKGLEHAHDHVALVLKRDQRRG